MMDLAKVPVSSSWVSREGGANWPGEVGEDQ